MRSRSFDASCDASGSPLCRFVLAFDGLKYVWNLGILLRCAGVMGVDGLFYTKGTADPFNWKTLVSKGEHKGTSPLSNAFHFSPCFVVCPCVAPALRALLCTHALTRFTLKFGCMDNWPLLVRSAAQELSRGLHCHLPYQYGSSSELLDLCKRHRLAPIVADVSGDPIESVRGKFHHSTRLRARSVLHPQNG